MEVGSVLPGIKGCAVRRKRLFFRLPFDLLRSRVHSSVSLGTAGFLGGKGRGKRGDEGCEKISNSEVSEGERNDPNIAI